MKQRRFDNISRLYKEVFSDNGEVRLCGREQCKELVNELEELRNDLNSVDIGSSTTGFLNIDGIKKLKL